MGYSLWRHKKSDTTEWLSMHVQRLLRAKNLQHLCAKCSARMNSLVWCCATSGQSVVQLSPHWGWAGNAGTTQRSLDLVPEVECCWTHYDYKAGKKLGQDLNPGTQAPKPTGLTTMLSPVISNRLLGNSTMIFPRVPSETTSSFTSRTKWYWTCFWFKESVTLVGKKKKSHILIFPTSSRNYK